MTDARQAAVSPANGLSFPVVGVGASAGGLSALQKLFETLPARPEMAFVVILHLSPKHESNAAAILQRSTRMTVTQVAGATQIEPNHVYVIPPTRVLLMVDGQLNLSHAERERGGHVVIDLFFRTLAQTHKERAIAVVLSGTGADGSVGIAEIKQQGGVALAQSPADAEYDGMPTSAIATGKVDIVLPIAELGPKLLDIWRNARAIELPALGDDDLLEARPPTSPEAAEDALRKIMSLMRHGTGHDFKHYKRATVLRRIERRLQVNSIPHLVAYADFLERQPHEMPLLLADMLIGVTNFFRDRDAFEALERRVVPALFDASLHEEPLRAWVAGCSTGEEAYSLLLLLSEEAMAAARPRAVQVFATDIDEAAIARGRDGVYPEAIVTDIPPSYLRKYFSKEGATYRISKPLRDRIVFATHNLLRDPPFSRLDLVSCRNLLIYLEREVQADVLQMFHFALRPGGYLFLGSSETADASGDLFTVVDKKQRIYRANANLRASRMLPRFPLGGIDYKPAGAPREERKPTVSIGALHKELLQSYAPPSLVVNGDGDIVHIARAEPYLRFPEGVPTQHLLSVVAPELRPALRAAMFESSQNRGVAHAGASGVERDDHLADVTVIVRPVQHADWPPNLRLVLFYETLRPRSADAAAPSAGQRDPLVDRLEADLQRKDAQLQRSLEEYETSAEDLKASNAINEELRSATEELETSKEELQSTNEELITVNHELKIKVDETAETNDDLRNLIASSGIATVFVDRDMRIKRFTQAAATIFNIIAGDIGRSLLDITHKLDYPQLADEVALTFNSLQTVEREVGSSDGRRILARLLPYRTAEDRIDGAVLIFIDVTPLRSAEQSVHMHQERMQLIADSMPDFAIMTMDDQGRLNSWSAGAQRLFGYAEAEVLGRSLELIYVPQDRDAGVPEAEMRQAQATGRAEDERWHLRKDGSAIYVSGIMASMALGKVKGFAKIARDMTAKKNADNTKLAALDSAVQDAADAAAAIKRKDEFLAVMSHELKHPLNLIQVNAQLLLAMPEAQNLPQVLKIAKTIQHTVKSQARIIDDLLDLSRIRAGKLVLSVAPVHLEDVLQSCVGWAAKEAAAKGVAFNFNATPEDLVVEADPVRVEQIGMNLLSNAIKFTAPGGRIDVSLERDRGDAVFEVVDTGRGIPVSFLPHIFGLFKQAESHTSRQEGGLGIGLALVHEFVTLQGGSVQAASAGEGRGATFTVRLPLKRDTDFGALDEGSETTGLSGLRILYVDDTLDTLQSFTTLLQLYGATVTPARSGEQALELVKKLPQDLIISDIGMPHMDGYALIRRLRELPQTAAVPAIALTGYGRDQDIEFALHSGFDGHLSKPVEMAALERLVAALVPPKKH